MRKLFEFFMRFKIIASFFDFLHRTHLHELVFLPMVARIRRKEIVYFLHINKTAGTSILSALEGLGWKTEFGYLIPLPHEVGLRRLPTRAKVAFFVRLPYTRFASGFEHIQKRGYPSYSLELSEAEEDAFVEFSSFEALVEGTISSENDRAEKARCAWCSIYHLRWSYRHYFGDIEYLRSQLHRIVFVGEQEDFAEDWKRFFKKFYGKEVPLEEKNVLAKQREILPGYREAIERIHPDEFLLYEEVLRRKAQLLEEESRSTEGRN
jgi:hypothetical protein